MAPNFLVRDKGTEEQRGKERRTPKVGISRCLTSNIQHRTSNAEPLRGEFFSGYRLRAGMTLIPFLARSFFYLFISLSEARSFHPEGCSLQMQGFCLALHRRRDETSNIQRSTLNPDRSPMYRDFALLKISRCSTSNVEPLRGDI